MRPKGLSAGGQGQGHGGVGRAASASPPHASGPARVRSYSVGGDGNSPKLLQKGGSIGEEGGKIVTEEAAAGTSWGVRWAVADGVGGMMLMTRLNDKGKGRRRGELWGERETGLAGGDGGSRHVYLGDMGHARAQRTLRSIAKDVQVPYSTVCLHCSCRGR